MGEKLQVLVVTGLRFFVPVCIAILRFVAVVRLGKSRNGNTMGLTTRGTHMRRCLTLVTTYHLFCFFDTSRQHAGSLRSGARAVYIVVRSAALKWLNK